MARVKVPITVIDAAGNAVPGASVHVKHRGVGTTAIAYQNETGPTTVANPLSTDAYGRISNWVEKGIYVADITGSGIAPYSEPFDAVPEPDVAALDTRADALEAADVALDGRLDVIETELYAEINGGADVAIPNTNTWVPLRKSDNSNVSVTLNVTGSQQWWIEGNMLVRADSTNDTTMKVALFLGATDYAVAHVDRLYWGTGALAGWRLVHCRRRVSLNAGTYVLTVQAKCETVFGGSYHRGAPINGGYVAARRVV